MESFVSADFLFFLLQFNVNKTTSPQPQSKI